MNDVLFRGLFKRLMARGLDPITAGELAAANYPSKKNQPTRPPMVSTKAVNAITEQFVDHRTLTPRQVWEQVWGMTPEQYFGIEFGSDQEVAETPGASYKADWYPDPTKRFEFRYWDGSQWTNDVSSHGRTYQDPVH
jgi:hypothetical protein